MRTNAKTTKIESEIQTLKILLCKHQFQCDLSIIRLRNDIPETGFNTEKEINNWYKLLEKKDRKYIKQSLYSKLEVCKLTGNGKQKNQQLLDLIDYRNEILTNSPSERFQDEIFKLARRNKLALKWEKYIKNIILFNKWEELGLEEELNFDIQFDKLNNRRKITIDIYEDTSREEVEKVWSKIKVAQKTLFSYSKGKRQPMERFERDKLAYELWQAEKSYEEIAQKLNAKFSTDYQYYEVSKFIERHRKKIGQ